MIAKDKQKHFAVGFAIGFAGGLSGHAALGVGGSFVAGWAKEALDRQDPDRTYDPWDAHWTAFGGLVGAAAGSFARHFFVG